jgi:O-antigen ligase
MIDAQAQTIDLTAVNTATGASFAAVPTTTWLSRVIFTGLLALMFITAIPYGSVEPWWEAVFSALIFILAALWAIDGALCGTWFVPQHVLAIPAVFLTFYAFVQSWTMSFDPYETHLVAMHLAALTLAGILLVRYTSSERRLRILVSTVILIGLASALFGIMRQITQREDGMFLLRALRKGVGYAQFGNHNHFSFLAEMALGLLVGVVAGRGIPRQRAAAYLSLSLPLWATLVLTNSRGAIVTMLCQIVFLMLLLGSVRQRSTPGDEPFSLIIDFLTRSRVARLILAVVLVLGIFIGSIRLAGDRLAERLNTLKDEITTEHVDPTFTGRAEIWKATVKLIKHNLLFGTGFGSYKNAISQYHPGSAHLVPYQAHNDYLELLASGGLVASVFALCFAFLFIRQAQMRLRKGTSFERAACLGALVGLFGVAVHSIFDFGLHIPAIAFLWVALVAIAAVSGAPLGISRQKTVPLTDCIKGRDRVLFLGN